MYGLKGAFCKHFVFQFPLYMFDYNLVLFIVSYYLLQLPDHKNADLQSNIIKL